MRGNCSDQVVGSNVGARTPLKNCGSHIDASHSRQPLVKGERLVRYEVNAVMPCFLRHSARCAFSMLARCFRCLLAGKHCTSVLWAVQQVCCHARHPRCNSNICNCCSLRLMQRRARRCPLRAPTFSHRAASFLPRCSATSAGEFYASAWQTIMLPRRVRSPQRCAMPALRARAPEQAREDTSPSKNKCDKQVSSWRHISCHTDKNRYYT